jgi:signal transduction histidine kinase
MRTPMASIVNILLVDDEQRNLNALEAILENPGYRLLRADDADKALKILLENDVAVIVLDIKMPGVSGFELAKMITSTKKFRQIPIVFLTAHMIEDQDIMAGYDAGAVDYLTKPLNPQILRHKIAVFAERFRKTRALAELNDTLEARVQERTAELEKSEAALRAASQQKDAFLATLAHELRNPLAPLRTGLDLLLRSVPQTPNVGRTLAAMNRQLDHMVRLIDDLLDLSRISRGILELAKEPVELEALIAASVETVQPFIDRRRQTCRLRSGGQSSALLDPTRIVQIVGNLLHNASKYTATGGEILIDVESDGDNVIVRVIDSGAGIPETQLERVFDMFAKIERSVPHANDGLGIGLALARQLARLHGGSLVASSAGEGLGATFTLSLPIVRPLKGSAGAAASNAAAGGSQKLNIVVIEDNEDAADMLAMWLEELGHQVHIGRTGTEGIGLVREFSPHLVLCDLGLPEMSGLDVCRQIEALGLPSKPLMVALTGWGMEKDRRRTREAGFQRHLVKPVAADALREILGSLAPAARG